ncbi:hypothetical protein TRM7557_02738 [Tritonibacter multivorans]|uniref:Uncharacterized protein n=1 Tax=Tritonibacter multivorans TaxID=928856 RepID=A0A0P1GF69_9RHOB|nr:hypothetical protein TRM7557_02738 [Tritonibacter multivorans]SFC74664.1 hypothetical protein SAMN04488049_10420 [Tritonibacter multivorans]
MITLFGRGARQEQRISVVVTALHRLRGTFSLQRLKFYSTARNPGGFCPSAIWRLGQ